LADWKSNRKISEILGEFSERYPAVDRSMVEDALDLLIPAVEGGGTLYLCGNGGSAADVDHIVGELMKGFVLKRLYGQDFASKLEAVNPEMGRDLAAGLEQGIRAYSLNSQIGLTTAFANDVNYEMAAAQQLAVLGTPKDVLWCLTTSGNSKNILFASVAAKAKGVKILAMTGATGGKVKAYADCCIAVPETETFKVQEYHLPVYHCLCLCLEYYFFGE